MPSSPPPRAGATTAISRPASNAPTDAFPTAGQIELACAQHEVQEHIAFEKTPGNYWDAELGWNPVRRASCRWEAGTTATALCRFQQSLIPSTLEREELLRHLTDRDWTWMSARMIHVDSQSNNNGGWIAPRGCHPEPRSRDIHARQEDTSALRVRALLKDRFHPLVLPLLRDLRALRAFATK